MLRLYGIPVAPADVRALVATLLADGGPDARDIAALLTKRLDRGGAGLVALEPAHRDAILAVIEDPPDGLNELRGRLADDAAYRHGLA